MTMMDGGERRTTGFTKEIQDVIDMLLSAAEEAEECLQRGNKAAGRRARKGLGEVKKMLTPLRTSILSAMKGEKESAA